MKNIIMWIILAIILGLISNLINNLVNKQRANSQTISRNYKEKPLMTEPEKNFFLKLKNLEPQYKIIPQINLSTIIEKISNERYRTELFRNIDYAIFTSDLSKVLLLIELNDSTHKEYQRKKRDIKVHQICKDANIPLMTFYTNYPNETQYVLNRILSEINKQSQTVVDQSQVNNQE